MLPKQYRLKKRAAFAATYKTGKSLYKDGITLFIGKEKTKDIDTKIGFVVSKKVHKRAVKRNRIRRLMRESCRLLIKSGNFPTKYTSLIFVGSSKILGKDFSFVDSTIKYLAGKLWLMEL